MRTRYIPFLAIMLSLVIAVAAPLPASAAIKVIVNDVPITDYDISQRARLLTLTQRISAGAARTQAQQELIDDQIKLTEARRVGINISTSDVDNAYNNIARNAKMTSAQLGRALGQSGIKPDTLKDRLRAQLAWRQVVQRRFRGDVDVDESDIIAALQKRDEDERRSSIEYDLQRVIVVVPKNSSGGFKSKRRRESDQIRSAFTGCDNFGAVLSNFSEVVVQPIGRRLETEVPDGLRKEIETLEPGNLTKPSPTGVGFEMIALCGKREIASDIALRTKLENELRAKETESQARRYLLEVRRRATIINR
ncbi:SurA N-terminal domain-containing protein [Roseibium denhamense]|uniref:Periplasmic chaperone for outer membrane proteins SurA n=1 Tax=Roseibium denhamense TaxID=76305 RepID=A0ABY1NVB1_9HYPH|nr:peptidylprolyl isomerase [Roseibium denhamense]SMP17906.1 periplasmic chaperone for outer membrane proteins SurA [Roseibium denhamense]